MSNQNPYKQSISILKQSIQKYGADYDKLSGILEMCAGLIKECPDEREYCFKWSGYAKQAAQALHIQTTKEEYGELYWKAMLFEAQNKLIDSYFLYLEKNREPKERFYAPKRKQFIKHGLIDAYQGIIDDIYDIVIISMPPGTGKAQPLYSKVLTPNGFIPMGEVKVGAKVISGTGNVCNVTGVYPQGVKPIYEITFNDGSKCRCSDEHLWKVQTIEDRNKEKYRVIELKDMLKNFKRGKQHNYSVDYVPKIEMKKNDLKIHPYLLGFLLGDGCFCKKNIGIATADKEIVEKLKTILPEGHEIVKDAKYNYRIKSNNGSGRKNKGKLRVLLEEYGLFGKYGDEKFIPNDYMYSSFENRVELLRGLLDSDGYVGKRGFDIEFSSSSKKLVDGIVELVHSLGGYASISEKKCAYINSDGEKINAKNSFRAIMEFSEKEINPFFVRRKAERYKPKTRGSKRFITNIEYAGEEECQCIMIDDESHLYITDDYIVTHNTTGLKFLNSGVIGWFPKDYTLFYSHSGDITRMYYDGVLNIVQDTNEYCWHEIFPDLQVTSTNAKMAQFNIGSYKPFPSLQTASVGSENAGKVRASFLLLVDDMIGKLEEALNKNIKDKQWGAYTVDARQRKTMNSFDKPCKEIIQATRWATDDVPGRVIEMYGDNPRVKVISIPDIDEQTGQSNFDYQYGGFTVEFFHDQALLMDDISYKCLYKQQPVEREGLLYPEDSVERYSELPKGEPEEITGQCDHKGSGTDFMFMFAAYKYGDWYYIEDVVCNRNPDYEIQYQDLTNLIVRNKMQNAFFESNQGGDRVSLEVDKRVQSQGHICNIKAIPTETNKEARIYQYANWIKQHCKFKEKSQYSAKSDYAVMMRQLFTYSVGGKNANDDIPDCFSTFAKNKTQANKMAKAEAVHNPFRTGGYGYGF